MLRGGGFGAGARPYGDRGDRGGGSEGGGEWGYIRSRVAAAKAAAACGRDAAANAIPGCGRPVEARDGVTDFAGAAVFDCGRDGSRAAGGGSAAQGGFAGRDECGDDYGRG